MPEDRPAYKGSPVVGYLRTARLDDQRIDSWEVKMRNFASAWGYNLTDIRRDVGRSGASVWKPELEKVISCLTKGRYVGAIILSCQHLGVTPSQQRRVVARAAKVGAWISCIACDEGCEREPSGVA